MPDSALLEMINATPEQRRALIAIDAARRGGWPDSAIFGPQGAGVLGGTALNIGGGYGLLPYAAQMAGITSNYQLGRGGLAADLARDEFNRSLAVSQLGANPFNIVTALDMMARTGAPMPGGGGGALENIQPYLPALPGTRYTDVADSILGIPDAATRKVIEDAYATDPVAADLWFRTLSGGAPLGTGPQAITGGAQAALTPAVASGPSVAATATPARSVTATAPAGGQTAQQAGARLLGSSLNVGMSNPRFRAQLGEGKVPGLGSLREGDWDRMSLEQKGANIGLLQSTGQFADAGASLQDYFNRYRHGGTTLGGSYR